LGELRQRARDAAEAAPRAGEELVPGAEPRERPVDVHLERRRDDLAVAVGHVRREPLLERELGDAEERGALRQLAGEILLPGLDLAAQLVAPRRDPVRPGGDGERPAAGPVDRERPAEPVDAEGVEGQLPPALVAGRLDADRGAEGVVAVLEDRRGDVDAVPDRVLHRVATAVDLRLDGLQEDARWRLLAGRRGHRS